MIVFKLERERPASTIGSNDKLYYVRGRELFCHDYGRSNSGVDIPIATLRRVGQQSQTDGIGSRPRFLTYNIHNPSEGNILVCCDIDGPYLVEEVSPMEKEAVVLVQRFSWDAIDLLCLTVIPVKLLSKIYKMKLRKELLLLLCLLMR